MLIPVIRPSRAGGWSLGEWAARVRRSGCDWLVVSGAAPP